MHSTERNPERYVSPTNPTEPGKASTAFTLIELLVVIAIIGILAALLIPAVLKAREDEKKKRAKYEITLLVSAIKQYQSHYNSRLPTTISAGTADFTYGGTSLDAVFGGPGVWSKNNSEVIAILMDFAYAKFPDGTANTANPNHQKNTQQIRCLEVNLVNSTNDPGVGPDLVYRDPWGNPYIISLDLNYDEKCADAVYERRIVSQSSGSSGFDGLFNAASTSGNSDDFTYNGAVMVWSLGPDRKADATTPANQGVNRDNILSWK